MVGFHPRDRILATESCHPGHVPDPPALTAGEPVLHIREPHFLHDKIGDGRNVHPVLGPDIEHVERFP